MRNLKTILILVAILALGSAPFALADGTPAGSLIGNTATVDYRVGGIDQAPVASNTATFLVDNRVDLTVTLLDGGAIQVIPGESGRYMTFSVFNSGNNTQDYFLSALAATTDDFNADNVMVYIDSNGNNVFDPALDTQVYIDELPMDNSQTVFIVGDIPLTATDGQVADYDLIARTAVGGSPGSQGAVITADDAAATDDPTLVQIVFADAAGSVDAVQDGRHTAGNQYQVGSALVDITKSSSVLNDPINGGVNPKAIPGATMGYNLLINNTGSQAADNVIIVDAIPASTAYVVNSAVSNPVGSTFTYSDNGGATWVYGPIDSGDGSDPNVTHVRMDLGTVPGTSSAQVDFRVLVD